MVLIDEVGRPETHEFLKSFQIVLKELEKVWKNNSKEHISLQKKCFQAFN